jgi:hypothetical protein
MERIIQSRARAPLGVALALFAAACASSGNDVPSPFVQGDEATVGLTVDNQDYRDATVYANWNGVRQRIGMVIGKTTETFTIPWEDFQVRLEVDFVGGGGFESREPIGVWPGEHVDFIIMPGW